jgi:putative ABC transport system permease protein
MLDQIREMKDEAIGAARRLARRPMFTVLATMLFALGVGALAAVFSVMNATMLRPLPYREPDQLVALTGTEPATRDSVYNMQLGAAQLSRWRELNRSFSALEGYATTTMKFLGGDTPEPVEGAFVTAGFFDVLGWKPEHGRTFTSAEEIPRPGVVMISHALWMRRFAGDPEIVGKAINIDEEPRTIIGVMPADFTMPFVRADAWVPIPMDQQSQVRKLRIYLGVGRLRENATIEQARTDLLAINKSLGAERPEEYRLTGVNARSLREALYGSQRATLFVLLAAGLLLLAVATVNVVSLTLGDAIARRMATMTRIAFGAERAHIMRIRIYETGWVALLGCVFGLVIARLGLVGLTQVAPDAFGRGANVSIDWLVVAVALLASVVAAVAAAVPAALQEASFSISTLAGTDAKGVGGISDRRRRNILLVSQVGIAVVLLVGASLLARNVQSLLSRPTGFQTEGVSVVELTFSPTTYTTPALRAEHARALLAAVKNIPGVTAAATIQTRFALNETMQTLFEVEGKPTPTGAQRFVNIRHVTPEVSSVLGIRLLRGRMFSEEDREGTQPVAIASASFVRQFWPDEDPIGQRVRRIVTQEAPWMEVVGVVDDIKDSGAGVPMGPVLFVSYLQQNTATARPTIVVRSAVPPGTLFPALRKAIWSADGNQTIDAINRLGDLMLRSAAQPRFAALVAGLLALSALTLLLSGIYAVTLHSVLRRTREIGVRMALGARPADVLWTTVRQSVVPVLIGAAIGAAAAVPAASWMRGVLAQGVSLADAPLFAAVLGAIVLFSSVAALIPARRALRVPPAIAIRDAG